MFFIAYAFKGQVRVFAGRVKIVSHLPCRTSAILKYFCPLGLLYQLFVCFVCFVALRPKSTAMVIAGQSVHLTTLFLGRLEQADNQ